MREQTLVGIHHEAGLAIAVQRAQPSFRFIACNCSRYSSLNSSGRNGALGLRFNGAAFTSIPNHAVTSHRTGPGPSFFTGLLFAANVSFEPSAGLHSRNDQPHPGSEIDRALGRLAIPRH
jgi:hypothetical protein